MKRFTGEFKKFITRGNVVDMAVGVLVGSSFTAIVNALSNNILKPIINWVLATLFNAESLSELYTPLKPWEYIKDADGNPTSEIDFANSIYIDWGSFIQAIINFLLIALVLFTIVKVINKLRAEHKEFAQMIAEKTLDRNERKELRAAGVKIRDKKAVEAYFAEKKRLADEAAAAEKAAAEEQARLDREANPTTEDLLKQILAEMRK
ncbi:MAG: large conductance mechanosensitive channel protein MscL [Clostridia bacterium]|nr:large conductance mechanosensitive channel protein MscL [Clostridia bacterium]